MSEVVSHKEKKNLKKEARDNTKTGGPDAFKIWRKISFFPVLPNKSQIVTNLSAMPVLLEVLSSDQNALLLQGGAYGPDCIWDVSIDHLITL